MQHREARLAAILYAQVLGFDRLFEEDSDEAVSLLSTLSDLFERICGEHRGRVVRSVRDTYLVEFPTSFDAVSCSIAIQQEAASQSTVQPRKYGLTIGVHVGDVHFLDNDAAGEPIIVATKLQSIARPGTTSVSEEVYGSVAGKLDVPMRFSGEVSLEGSAKKLRAYEIGPSYGDAHDSSLSAPTTNAEDFDELKGFVLEQIKRVGRRLSTDRVRSMLQSRSPELDEAIEKLADMGFLSRGSHHTETPRAAMHDHQRSHAYTTEDREAWREARRAFRDAIRESRHEHHHHHHHHHESWGDAHGEIDEPNFSRYRERVIERAHRMVGGFAGHLIPFLVVNGFLFFINLSTGFGFPWFLFPLGGWGIGLISHLVAVGTRRREKAEVESLPESLDNADYQLLRRFHRARSTVRATLGSTISVAAFLLMINLIVSPGFLWALFPIGGLLIAVVSAVTSYASKRGSLRKRLKELFSRRGAKGSGDGAPAETLSGQENEDDPPIVRQAMRIADSILEQSRKLDPQKAYLGEDLEPLLLNYIGQIRTLSRRGREVDEIMAAIPRTELNRDLSALRGRLEKATDASLKLEYEKSIDQIERQNRSFNELENQKELLELRISGSVNSLKQMQIDLARMTGISSANEIDSIGRLRERSRELSDYLQDFSEGYEEIGGLPLSGEEERKRADQLLKEFKEKEER